MPMLHCAGQNEAARNRLYVSCFGEPYKELFGKSMASGYEVWSSYSADNFDNPFRDADERLYNEIGGWGEVFRDMVEGRVPERGEARPAEGFVPVTYRVLAGTKNEKQVKGWLPRGGLIVPVEDEREGCRFFVRGTLMPERTVAFADRSEAEKAFGKYGIPLIYMSGFYRLDDYENVSRFSGREFNPSYACVGRFYVNLGMHPSASGNAWAGTRTSA